MRNVGTRCRRGIRAEEEENRQLEKYTCIGASCAGACRGDWRGRERATYLPIQTSGGAWPILLGSTSVSDVIASLLRASVMSTTSAVCSSIKVLYSNDLNKSVMSHMFGQSLNFGPMDFAYRPLMYTFTAQTRTAVPLVRMARIASVCAGRARSWTSCCY